MTFRPSIAKIRLLCVLVCIICAIFVSALIQQNPAHIEANLVPKENFSKNRTINVAKDATKWVVPANVVRRKAIAVLPLERVDPCV